jgi:hypothetical protein
MSDGAEAKILRNDLARYQQLLTTNTDERVRAILQRLIAETESRLAALKSPPRQP